MKTMDEKAKEYGAAMGNPEKPINATYDGFKAGVEFAQRWIPIEEELPEKSDKIVVSGFYSFTENPVIVKTVNGKYSIAKRNLFHGNKNSKWEWMGSSSFSDSVTHWRPIELK